MARFMKRKCPDCLEMFEPASSAGKICYTCRKINLALRRKTKSTKIVTAADLERARQAGFDEAREMAAKFLEDHTFTVFAREVRAMQMPAKGEK